MARVGQVVTSEQPSHVGAQGKRRPRLCRRPVQEAQHRGCLAAEKNSDTLRCVEVDDGKIDHPEVPTQLQRVVAVVIWGCEHATVHPISFRDVKVCDDDVVPSWEIVRVAQPTVFLVPLQNGLHVISCAFLAHSSPFRFLRANDGVRVTLSRCISTCAHLSILFLATSTWQAPPASRSPVRRATRSRARCAA